MKRLYEASNALEAHMIVDLLQQQGIAARIDGEYLQGAVGEIPAAGLVRVMVDEAEYLAARAVVDHWDASQPPAAAPSPAPPRRRGVFFAAGLLAGVACTAAWFQVPVSADGIDHDRDGVLDERSTYSPSGLLLRQEIDRNLDGRVDYVARFDAHGAVKDADADDDFDGVFETHLRFRQGHVESSETSLRGDGRIDQRSFYTHGVLASTEHLDPGTGRLRKVGHFTAGRLTHAEIDTDGDGTLDQRNRYDAAGEVVAREPALGGAPVR